MGTTSRFSVMIQLEGRWLLIADGALGESVEHVRPRALAWIGLTPDVAL